MFVHEEYYYLCCTVGSCIRLYRSKNPVAIHTDGECEFVEAFRPREGENTDCETDWVHAYLSPDRTGGRYVFIEPYRIENGRVIIGDGSLKPAPFDTVQTITAF